MYAPATPIHHPLLSECPPRNVHAGIKAANARYNRITCLRHPPVNTHLDNDFNDIHRRTCAWPESARERSPGSLKNSYPLPPPIFSRICSPKSEGKIFRRYATHPPLPHHLPYHHVDLFHIKPSANSKNRGVPRTRERELDKTPFSDSVTPISSTALQLQQCTA